MKRNHLRYALMLAALLACAALGYFFSKKTVYREESFFCTSSFTLHSGSEMLSLSINFNLNHGDGFTTMNGTFFRDGLKQSHISLEKEFLYTQKRWRVCFQPKNQTACLNSMAAIPWSSKSTCLIFTSATPPDRIMSE